MGMYSTNTKNYSKTVSRNRYLLVLQIRWSAYLVPDRIVLVGLTTRRRRRRAHKQTERDLGVLFNVRQQRRVRVESVQQQQKGHAGETARQEKERRGK